MQNVVNSTIRHRFLPFAGALVLALCASFSLACGDNQMLDGNNPNSAALLVEPLDAEFPTTPVDPTHPSAVTFTIHNKAAFTVTDLVLNVTSTGEDFVLEGNQCASTLPVGGKCKTQIVFRPKAAGSRSGQLVVKSRQSGSQSYSLRGQAEEGAGLTLTPTFQDFGRIALNTDSPVFTFELANGSQRRSGALKIGLEGVNKAEFAFANNACGATLAAGEKCTMAVVMRPISEGSKIATLNVSEGESTTPLQVTLAGSGRGNGGLDIRPAQHSFGEVAIGNQGTQIFTVENTGLEPTAALAATILGDTSASFTVSPASTCIGTALAPTQTCDVLVVFAPATIGDKAGTLRVSGTPGGQASAALTGKGTPLGDLLEFTPASQDFGEVAVGSRTSALFTLRNNGDVATGVPTFNTVESGTNFSVVPSDACKQALPPGGTCLVTVEFVPLTSGEKNASLIATALPGGQVTTTLRGRALDPLTITPATKDFGDVKLNATSTPSDLFIVRNNGAIATGALQINLNAGGSNEFSISSNTCAQNGTGIVLAANGECFITVGFLPTTLGAKVATLTVSGSPGGSATSTIRGTGIAAGLTVNPTDHNFGSALVDQNANNGPTFAFTVRNDSPTPTSTLSTAINPEQPNDYAITSDSCEGRQLSQGASCSITVRFDPTALGDRFANLEIIAGASGTTTVALRGTGTSNAELLIEPSRYDYGTVSVSQYIERSFTVVNNSSETLEDLDVSLLDGSASFAIVSDGCTNDLEPGGRCVVSVRFGSTTASAAIRTRTLSVSTSNNVDDATSVLRGRVN